VDGFVCSIKDENQGWLLWRGRTEHAPIRTLCHVVRQIGFGWGLFARFNVLKRFVDAEIDWIEDDAV
jgi:hypothetical protein